MRRNRLIFLCISVTLFSLLIGGKLAWLQLVEADEFRTKARGQHVRRITVPARRSAILDRNGQELAVSVQAHSLYAHPPRITADEAIRLARQLSPILDVPQRELQSLLRADRSFVYLKRFLTPEAAQTIRNLPPAVADRGAVDFITEAKRDYPQRQLGVHVVGYASIDGVGVEGVEKEFDPWLRGEPTVFLVHQDARSRQRRRPLQLPKRLPHDVVLTLNLSLQHIVERELERAIATTGARAASAVLIDPAIGEVLALANWPTVDANQYGQSKPEQRINRAIVHYYEPGSTFKVVPMAAALEQGVVRPEQTFYCELGQYRMGRRLIRDIAPHGVLTAQQIIAESSNIGMVKVTRDLPPVTLRRTIERFGFGSKTGIELPGESVGLVRHESEWSAFSKPSLSFGQEIGVTVLQMASALSAIANDGVLHPPRVVLGLRDDRGRLQRAPSPSPRRVASSATARQLRRMMEQVIADGTGNRASLAGYAMAGKSGTAQKTMADGKYSPDQYMASFGGFGPARQPRLAGIVVLDSPRGAWTYGGQVAAPVFARIMEDSLRYLRAPYDHPPVPPRHAYAQQSRRQSGQMLPLMPQQRTTRGAEPQEPNPLQLEELSDLQLIPSNERVPNLVGLDARQAVRRLSASGCRVDLLGQGLVVAQDPRPGAPLPQDRTCRLRLEHGS